MICMRINEYAALTHTTPAISTKFRTLNERLPINLDQDDFRMKQTSGHPAGHADQVRLPCEYLYPFRLGKLRQIHRPSVPNLRNRFLIRSHAWDCRQQPPRMHQHLVKLALTDSLGHLFK